MTAYYTHDGTTQQGPFSLDQLLQSGIAANTQVWSQELANWTPAKDVYELRSLFYPETVAPAPTAPVLPSPPVTPVTPTPTSINAAYAAQPLATPPIYFPQPQRRNTTIWTVLLGLVILGTGYFIYGAVQRRNNPEPDALSSEAKYKESKMSIGDYERSHASEFLVASATQREKMTGDKVRMIGKVSNKATVANFKEVVVEVTYFSASQAPIGTDHFVVKELMAANSSKTFDWTIKPPATTKTMVWQVIGGKGF